MEKAVLNWSGGKDSSLTLYHIQKSKKYDIQCLLTSFNSQHQRVSMHGVRVDLIEKQAQHIGIPLHKLMVPEMPSMEIYDQMMTDTLADFKNRGIKLSVFGDIFLEDLKKYREDQLLKIDMKGVFPIWKIPTSKLIEDFIDLGFKAVLVCVNEKYLDKSFLGRVIDRQFVKDLPNIVDPCGENGEFHSFVYAGPIFKKPIQFQTGESVYRNYNKNPDLDDDSSPCPGQNYDTGFWYLDLLLK